MTFAEFLIILVNFQDWKPVIWVECMDPSFSVGKVDVLKMRQASCL